MPRPKSIATTELLFAKLYHKTVPTLPLICTSIDGKILNMPVNQN